MSTQPTTKNQPAVDANASITECYCGCGQTVTKYYRPGHDARAAGNAARLYVENGDDSAIKALPSDALRSKAIGMAGRLKLQAQAKVEREAAKAERKASKPTKSTKAKASEVPPAILEIEPVKIGRWTYPARQVVSGGNTETQRNERRDGSGNWIPVS